MSYESLNQRQIERLQAMTNRYGPIYDQIEEGYFDREDRRQFLRLASQNIFFGYGDALKVGSEAVIFTGTTDSGKTSSVEALAKLSQNLEVMSNDMACCALRRGRLNVFHLNAISSEDGPAESVPLFPVKCIFFLNSEPGRQMSIRAGSWRTALDMLTPFEAKFDVEYPSEALARKEFKRAITPAIEQIPVFRVPRCGTHQERIKEILKVLNQVLRTDKFSDDDKVLPPRFPPD